LFTFFIFYFVVFFLVLFFIFTLHFSFLLCGRSRSAVSGAFSGRTGTAVDAAVTTASLNAATPGRAGTRPDVSKSPFLPDG